MEYCNDCGERNIDLSKAYCLKDKTGELICIDCADYHYDVTLVDPGRDAGDQVVAHVSTWVGDGPKRRQQGRRLL